MWCHTTGAATHAPIRPRGGSVGATSAGTSGATGASSKITDGPPSCGTAPSSATTTTTAHAAPLASSAAQQTLDVQPARRLLARAVQDLLKVS